MITTRVIFNLSTSKADKRLLNLVRNAKISDKELIDGIQKSLKNGANINTKDKRINSYTDHRGYGYTPLMLLVMQGRTNVVDFLIQRNQDKSYAFHMVSVKNLDQIKLRCSEWLATRKNERILLVNCQGTYFALIKNYQGEHQFIELPKNLDCTREVGRLFEAQGYVARPKALKSELNVPTIHELVDFVTAKANLRVDVFEKTSSNNMAHHMAAREGHQEIYEALIRRFPALLNYKGEHDLTGPEISATYKHEKMAKAIQAKESNPYFPTVHQWFPEEIVRHIAQYCDPVTLRDLPQLNSHWADALKDKELDRLLTLKFEACFPSYMQSCTWQERLHHYFPETFHALKDSGKISPEVAKELFLLNSKKVYFAGDPVRIYDKEYVKPQPLLSLFTAHWFGEGGYRRKDRTDLGRDDFKENLAHVFESSGSYLPCYREKQALEKDIEKEHNLKSIEQRYDITCPTKPIYEAKITDREALIRWANVKKETNIDKIAIEADINCDTKSGYGPYHFKRNQNMTFD